MTDTRDEWIRMRAYAIWEDQGHPSGRDSEHWEQAKRERDALEKSAASTDGKEVKTRAKRAPAANGAAKAAPKKTASRKAAS